MDFMPILDAEALARKRQAAAGFGVETDVHDSSDCDVTPDHIATVLAVIARRHRCLRRRH